jgi:transcription elongation factor Elf1
MFLILSELFDKDVIMPDSKVSKTYIGPGNKFTITCPHCAKQKVVLASLFSGHNNKLKVKCYCEKTFMVHLEFRKNIRKKTELKGTYINHSQEDRSGVLLIQDISMTGLAFTSYAVKKFIEGDELSITFNLDDSRRTEISKNVIVKDIRQNSVGCVYESAERAFSPLGYYINDIT